MSRKTIIFYNPAAPYYTMPLQFLALASVLDRKKYDIQIVDARIEKSPRHAQEKVLSMLPQAICVGISVITGTPISDAVTLTAKCKSASPDVPVVWGGWHPSIYPEQCLREGGADFCVIGQGEQTFLELLETIESGSAFDSIHGLAHIKSSGFVENHKRKFIDINQFPAYDYSLLSLERYFSLKGVRQLDFYSSQGCPYRCGFCADPFVYNRRWSGLKSSRILSDVVHTVQEHNISDVHFLDENFFANRNRVLEFCRAYQEQRHSFTWAATSRADQIAPLDDDLLSEMRRANLRKVIIGAESGSQEMLDFMKKDTLAEETLTSAEKLSRHGIGATFNFIVGFPEEEFRSTQQTLDVIRSIKHINPEYEFNIFFFTPYPGTELFNYIVEKGYKVPQTLLEWSRIDFVTYAGYWIGDRDREYVERFKFYTKLGTEPAYSRATTRPLQILAAQRFRRNYFNFPIEKKLVNFVRHKILRQSNW